MTPPVPPPSSAPPSACGGDADAPSLALIVPTYGQWDYALKACESFKTHTPVGKLLLIVLDDAHPDYDGYRRFNDQVHDLDVPFYMERFEENRGLTRSWNAGLNAVSNIRHKPPDYVICGNSDILFTPGWYEPLLFSLQHGYDLVGPVTNAPGRVIKQNVTRFLKDYQPSDHPFALTNVAKQLAISQHFDCLDQHPINGFFMMAKTATWLDNPFDDFYVFDPGNRMEGAYELQKRWDSQGKKIGFCPGSFIFHYRSVSRGKAGLRGRFGKGAYRPQ